MCCLVTDVLIPVTWSTDSRMWYPNISYFLDSGFLLHGVPHLPVCSYFFFEFILLLPLVLAMSCQVIKKPSWCLLPMVSFPLDFILVGGANDSLWAFVSSVWKSSLWHFSSAFSTSVFIFALVVCLSFTPQHELHAVLQRQSRERHQYRWNYFLAADYHFSQFYILHSCNLVFSRILVELPSIFIFEP